MKRWKILRTDIETNISELYRIVHTDDEGVLISHCKRMNAFNTRNEFPNHYTYREVKV